MGKAIKTSEQIIPPPPRNYKLYAKTQQHWFYAKEITHLYIWVKVQRS